MDTPALLSPNGLLIAWRDAEGEWMSVDRYAPSRVMRLNDEDVAHWTPLVPPATAIRRHLDSELRNKHNEAEWLRRDLHRLSQEHRTNPLRTPHESIATADRLFKEARAVERYLKNTDEAYPAVTS